MSRLRRWRLALLGAVVLLVTGLVTGALLGTSSGHPAPLAAEATAPSPAATAGGGRGAASRSGSHDRSTASAAGPRASGTVTLSLSGRTVGAPIPSGYLGFSFEFPAVRAYTGTDPHQIDPVLVALIRNLTPGQRPVLRIGGDSTDLTYVPVAGQRLPAYIDYRLTPGWLATTGALVRELNARLILGLNLVGGSPDVAAAEARAFLHTFGRRAIDALEIGNEPNVYSKLVVDHVDFGVPLPARPRDYGYHAFRHQFRAVAARAEGVPLAGPALAIGPDPYNGAWIRAVPGFLRGDAQVSTLTVHRYPLRNCYVPPSSPQYPTIAHLLARYATVDMADSLRPWVAIAHRQHRLLRMDELNSVACRGRWGVSDTFASALWATDALFALARVGVDGIDMHTLSSTAYQLFWFSHRGGRWHARVNPIYYGLQLFAQAAPAGARLLDVGWHGRAPGLSVWATRAGDRVVRLVLINKDVTHDRRVVVRVRRGGPRSATVERMLAPSVASRSGATLGGQGYGSATYTGRLAAPALERVAVKHGRLVVTVPHGSAALVSLG